MSRRVKAPQPNEALDAIGLTALMQADRSAYSARPRPAPGIVNYTMSERATHSDFSVRNQNDALPNLQPHRHEYFQIHVQLRGSTTHYIGSVTRRVDPGTLCFIPPYKLHFIPTVPDSEYYLINTTQSFMLPGLNVDPLDLEDVSIEQAPELAPFKYQEYLDFKLDGEDLETVGALCSSMLKESSERGPGSTVLCRAYLHQCIGLVCRRFGQKLWHLAEQRISNSAKRETMVRLGHFLRTNFDKQVSLTDAAEVVGLTPTYLAHLVKKETGKTFLELLTERRLDRAKELMLHSSLSIARIAESAGFSDFAYFTRRFKQLTGVSPSRFRTDSR
jgi:AraC-like DNA-binding protein/mannose-6-phosphate isomerase-like protein (cupin superfamily)